MKVLEYVVSRFVTVDLFSSIRNECIEMRKLLLVENTMRINRYENRKEFDRFVGFLMKYINAELNNL